MALLLRAFVRVSVPVSDKPRLGGPQSDLSFDLHRTIPVTEVSDVLFGSERVGEAEAFHPYGFPFGDRIDRYGGRCQVIDLEAGHSQIRDELLDEVDAIMHQAAFGGRDPLLNQVE
ncbi:hypothetical protein FA743_09670 [Paracoccus gahaiensis]|uniref:Uncharacterized protein n=2 Tax=Paracoccus TaxID=265 RepID=A0A4Z1BJP4_9RHOB|nr:MULTISPECIES: hypothetical protein [Paracoccus]TGN57840.1 hypothetical protein E4L95_12985 [Paracoccus liaowanqingii]TJZ91740.1 hypothetical protein FA743_09670 [Paracoccus gahaiensis]